MASSAQTLTESERRLAAEWAAMCAERVLWLFEAENRGDGRRRAAIARARVFARGELDTASFANGSAVVAPPVTRSHPRPPPQLVRPVKLQRCATWVRMRSGQRHMRSRPPVWRLQVDLRPPRTRSSGNSHKWRLTCGRHFGRFHLSARTGRAHSDQASLP
jgi:hypothetical protein